MKAEMKYPKNDDYVAGWFWAMDHMRPGCNLRNVEREGQGVAHDASEDPDMFYEGVIDACKYVALQRVKR